MWQSESLLVTYTFHIQIAFLLKIKSKPNLMIQSYDVFSNKCNMSKSNEKEIVH